MDINFTCCRISLMSFIPHSPLYVEYIPKLCISTVSGLCPSVLNMGCQLSMDMAPYARKMENSTVLLKKSKNSHINFLLTTLNTFQIQELFSSNSKCYME
jgi:hypothetical protein